MSAEKSHHQVREEILQSLQDSKERQIFKLGLEMGELLQDVPRNREAIKRNIEAARQLGILIDLEDL